MGTNNLNRTELAESQNNKHVTVNDSDGALDAALTSRMDVAVTDGTNLLTAAVTTGRAVYFNLINAGSPPTAAFTVQFPTTDRGYIYVKNGTSFTATLKISGQAGAPTLVAGARAIFIVDATDGVKKLTGAGASSNFTDLDDTFSSYTGLKSRLLAVTAAENGISVTTDNVFAAVRLATSSNITIASGLENGDTVDGVVVATDDDVLLYGQTDPKENGIYRVVASGAASRRFDANVTGTIRPGMMVYVRSGSNAGGIFVCTNANNPTFGSTNITFSSLTIAGMLPLSGGTMTGALITSAGSASLPGLGIAETDTGFWNVTANTIGMSCNGAEVMRFDATGLAIGTGAAPAEALEVYRSGTAARVMASADNAQPQIFSSRFSTDASAPVLQMRKSRGSKASPTICATSDRVGSVVYQGYDGTNNRSMALISVDLIEGTPSTSAMQGRYVLTLTNAGAVTSTEIMRLDHSTGLSMFGANPVIDNNRIIRLRSYTKGTLPAVPATGIVFCSDEDGYAQNLFSDGTNWRRTVDGKISGTTNKKKQTIYVPAGAMSTNTTNGATALATLETATNKLNASYLAFPDGATTKYASFNVVMPKSWDEGTVTFIPHWMHPSTTTNFGVVWQLRAVAISDTDAMDAAFGTAGTSTDTGGSTDTMYKGPESSAITIAGSPTAQDSVFFQIFRDPTSGSDTLAVDARLLGVTVFFSTDDDTDA